MELAEHYFDRCRNAGGLSDLHIFKLYNAFVDEYQNEYVEHNISFRQPLINTKPLL